MSSEVRDEWQAAIDFGIDVTLLEENLRRTPAERLAELEEMNAFVDDIQARNVPLELRRQLAAEALVAKFGDLLRYAGP
ncbi:MAG: hypothetical protein JNK56_13515 [Myxococcales bacterium]|nr:hypothetical protein [Myxococcales bacterium]